MKAKRRTRAEKRGLARKKAARVLANKEGHRKAIKAARQYVKDAGQWTDEELLAAVIAKDPKAIRLARAHGEIIRERLRRQFGTMNIAVQLVREARDAK